MSGSNNKVFGGGASLEGEVLQGHYLIERLVAQGGMAWLYRATHLALQVPMAIKLLYPQLAENPKIRARFLDEARIQFQLQHPHIVHVTDVIQQGTLIGAVMEWIEGEDLKQWLKRLHRPMTPEEMWCVMEPTLEALHFAHQRHLIHRDIKPANILLCWQGTRPLPKLSDFGIAKVASQAQEERTATGATLGTVEFMAPEQIRDSKRVDARADIYSLGVMLYQMATGSLPFRGGPEVLIYKQMYEDPQPPRELQPSIPVELEQVIVRCLQKSPELRFQNCMELKFALSSALAGQEASPIKPTLEMPPFVDASLSLSSTASPEEGALVVPASALPERDLVSGSLVSLPEVSDLGATESLVSAVEDPAASEPMHRRRTVSVTSFPSSVSVGEEGVEGAPSRRWRWSVLGLLLVGLVGGGWWIWQGTLSSRFGAFSVVPESRPREPTPEGQREPTRTRDAAGVSLRRALSAQTGQDAAPSQDGTAGACVEGTRRPCYTGPSATLGQGRCKAGVQICRKGRFGPCVGQIVPAKAEQCNGVDDDCDGSVDETFPKQGKSCSRRVGQCIFAGTWTCSARTKRLRCKTSRLRRRGVAAVRLRLRPRGLPVRLSFQRRSWMVRNFTCLEVKGRGSISLSAKGYQLCKFILPARSQTWTLRLKRQSDIEERPSYCKQ